MAGQQPLKLLILVRIQVPEPRENSDFMSGFSLDLWTGDSIKPLFRHRGVFESKSRSQGKNLYTIMRVGRNDPCPCGSSKKYKKCCLGENEGGGKLKKRVMEKSRRIFISDPYKDCPNSQCRAKNAFGVFMPISESRTYSRECVECGYQESFELPKIEKKIVYLDQFVISNLIKLLDKSHPSHREIKSDPFWESLFIKLERASKSQAVVCPDSFYHMDESMTGRIDFKLMKRLYEHFSSGKTLYPSAVIEKNQIAHHFKGWLEGAKVKFEFKPEEIAFGKDLNSWSIGIRVSVGGNPYLGQIENLQKINATTREQLRDLWVRWQREKDVGFVERIKEETSGFGKGLINIARQFAQKKATAMAKFAAGEKYEMDVEDFFPPLTNDILEALIRIARIKGLRGNQISEIILKYFNDIDSLLEIPQIRISSVMFAGLAHRAANGKKNPPKSTADVQFISSYLPYCDALFVDKESAILLKEFPKGTPQKFRLAEFNAQIFSLGNKEQFLSYLDRMAASIPAKQIEILKDIGGEDYGKPYWSIIEHEKSKRLI